MKCYAVVGFILTFIVGGLAAEERNSSTFESVMRVAHDRTIGNDVRLARLKDILRTHRPSAEGKILASPEAQRDLFMALDVLVSYGFVYSDPDVSRNAERMRSIFAELESSHRVDPEMGESMFRVSLASWDVPAAKELLTKFPSLNQRQLPFDSLHVGSSFISGVPSYIRIRESSARLESISLNEGKHVVVVSGCGISNRAANDIDSNESVRQSFANAHVIWLAPASREVEVPEILDWNRKNPREPIVVAYRNAEWKDIDFSQAPSFYFYDSGRLVATHQGWSTDGSIPKEVLKGLALLR